MSELLLVCLMVLVVIGNTSGRWTKKSEEDPKDLKNEKENMKEAFGHWRENKHNKRYITTTSTSTMPPTTKTTKIPETPDKDFEELMKAIEEMKDKVKEIKEEMRKERKDEMQKIKEEVFKERREDLKLNNTVRPRLTFFLDQKYSALTKKRTNRGSIYIV